MEGENIMEGLQNLQHEFDSLQKQCRIIMDKINSEKRKLYDGMESDDGNRCKRPKGASQGDCTSTQENPYASAQSIFIYSRYCMNQELKLNNECVQRQLNYIKQEFKKNPITSIYLSDIVTCLKIKHKFLTTLPRGTIRALLSQVSGE